MILKDLRSVLSDQVSTNVTVQAGEDSVVSGTLWLFDVDDSLDELKVIDLYPNDNVLEIKLRCTPDQLKDTDWSNAFNQEVIESINNGPDDTLIEK